MPIIKNNFDWNELLLFIKDQRVIPVIGKELLLVTVDGKQQLLEQYLATQLVKSLQINADDFPKNYGLNDVALGYLDQEGNRNRRKIYSHLKSIVDRSELPVPEPLRKLAEITDFKLFISLTFDSLLLNALNEIRFGGEPKTNILSFSTNRLREDLPVELKRMQGAYVYHLFGLLSTTMDYAVCDEDYLEFIHFLQTETKRPQLIFDEFLNNHLLFMGCGYENWLERFLIRTITNQRLLVHRNTSEFLTDSQVQRDVNLTVFLQHYDTEVFLSDDPAGFVNSLHERWCAEHSSKSSTQTQHLMSGRMQSGAIFLSFANEDRDTVREVKKVLEKAALDLSQGNY